MGKAVAERDCYAVSVRLSIVHISPHPDDEAVGCPATLLALRKTGFPVTNLVTSLGKPADHTRRRAEVIQAGRIGSFDVEILDDVINANPDDYEAEVTAAILTVAAESQRSPVLLLSPSPHDKHPRHEAAGRATASAAQQLGVQATWWMYGVWGALPLPTACYSFDQADQDEAERLLSAYAGEVQRNDYRRLIRGRAMAASVLGAEQVFGFGSSNSFSDPYVELFTETSYRGNSWLAGNPRRINVDEPLAELSSRDITAWITARSPSDQVGW